MRAARKICLIAVLGLAWMEATSAAQVRPGGPPGAHRSGDFILMDWDDLLPANERNAYEARQAPQHDYLGEAGPAARQSGSSAVRLELDGKRVKLPGFVVPLLMSSDGIVSEFFLVPYFGACIHVPPPPPNQIVYVKMEKGFRLTSIFDPQWITGVLTTQKKALRMTSSAYSMTAQQVEPYE